MIISAVKYPLNYINKNYINKNYVSNGFGGVDDK